MPLDKKLKFSDAFSGFDEYNALREQEDGVWRRLALLDDAAVLGPNDWTTLHADYAEANAFNDRMRMHVIYPLTYTTMGETARMPDIGREARAAGTRFFQPMI